MNSNLKDDNKDLLIEIDKFTKRVRQLENSLGRESEQTRESQDLVKQLKRDVDRLTEELEDKQALMDKNNRKMTEIQLTHD